MDGEWIFKAKVTLDDSAMEESLIETFGCVDYEEKVIKIYVSNDKKQIRRDVCVGGRVVDSQATVLSGFFERGSQTAGTSRLAAA